MDDVKKYIEAINNINEPMEEFMKKYNSAIKIIQNATKQTNKIKELNNKMYIIKKVSDQVSEISNNLPRQKMKFQCDIIKQIMVENNGYITTELIKPLNISRSCFNILEKNNEIEKISRGIYMSTNIIEDSYYIFQQRYSKTIFSHMNVLYFYGLTEIYPGDFTVTVPNSYHVDNINEKCDAFYVNDADYELRISEVETPAGNKVKAYDVERTICDIIRSKSRMDLEQVKKSVKMYIKSDYKNLNRLSEYSNKMKINKEVMEFVGMYYE